MVLEWLQWGRSKNAAEMGPVHPVPFHNAYASMGPQQKCCGNAAQVDDPLKDGALLQWGRSKNAAEIVSHISHAGTAAKLQWGRSKNAAEIRELCRRYAALVRFNGAAAKMLRKSAAYVVVGRGQLGDASMGPQQKCCGNLHGSGKRCGNVASFNGAAAKMLRK